MSTVNDQQAIINAGIVDRAGADHDVQGVTAILGSAGHHTGSKLHFKACDSRTAKSYKRIERIIQSACIEACTKESLEIPFPHLSLVQKPLALAKQ